MHESLPLTNTREQLSDELDALTTEAVIPGRPDLDTMDTLRLVTEMNLQDAIVPAVVGAQSAHIASAIDALVERFRRGGRLFYLGAGTPGRIGILDASECPPTFGTDPGLVVGLIAGGHAAILRAVENAEDDIDAAAESLREYDLSADDTVVGVSASGRTPYVLGGMRYAKSIGALTISVASNDNSPMAALADIPIDVVVGPEFVSGSTRLKAGTAQKLVLNMLTTISMIKLGKTYNGVMVDLQATNEKLQVRSERTVARATGAELGAVRAALTEAGGSVKEAILMIATGLSHERAEEELERANGFLRIAIQNSSA